MREQGGHFVILLRALRAAGKMGATWQNALVRNKEH
jgi:hypothetical protein